MSAPSSLWRSIRPLEEGATASWMRTYYELLVEMSFSTGSVADVAKVAIRHAYETFRAELVSVSLQDGDEWNVLPYRQNGIVMDAFRMPIEVGPDGPRYQPGQIVEIPDVADFAETFAWMKPVADRGIRSLVAAAFGSRIHGRGYLSFSARTEQHYSDDEYVLMCLHALAAGIGFDRAGANVG